MITLARPAIERTSDRLLGIGFDSLRFIGQRSAQPIAQTAIQTFYRRVDRPASSRARLAIDYVLPGSPRLTTDNLPSISILIACHEKDLPVLETAIHAAVAASRNPIRDVVLVSPHAGAERVRKRFPDARVMRDEEVVPASLRGVLEGFVPPARRGWVIQQLVKILASRDLDSSATLVVDADTILLTPRQWIDSEDRQLLCVAHEYHTQYVEHAQRVWGVSATRSPLTFVTHHQLMQRTILIEMFGDGVEGLERWLRLAHWSELSAVSEYHDYGAYLTNQHPRQARWAHWGNTGAARTHLPTELSDPEVILDHLRSTYPRAYSVSFHSYLA